MSVVASTGEANDRLPRETWRPYSLGIHEARKYVQYLIRRVWTEPLEKLKATGADTKALAAKADAVVDEIVELALPFAQKMVQDSVLGTRETHLRVTLYGKTGKDTAKANENGGAAASPVEAMRQAIEATTGVADKRLLERLEQALTEDLEDFAQRDVEVRLGLPMKGRPRNAIRPLSLRYEKAYRDLARPEVHGYTYWWLRKKQRLMMMQMATTMSEREIDRARHTGAIWRLTSGESQDAWAQNRLRIDFKWGRFNWEVERRRIRRRMDQDLAEGTWALTRLAKTLLASSTLDAIDKHVRARLRKAMSKSPLREKAERFPESRGELDGVVAGMKPEIDAIMNRAMDSVKLPSDMAEQARDHGRRFLHEEIGPEIGRTLSQEAAPFVAARRVRAKLTGWVAESLARFDPGADARREELRRRAISHVRDEIAPLIDGEVEATLRDLGSEVARGDGKTRPKAVQDVFDRFGLERELERAVERRLLK